MIAGRYSLDAEIGRGGMGVVWRGEDQVLGRDVALKRIGLAPGGASNNLLRAEREAKLAASLNHPNVVAVFDLVVEDDEHWLVMEHVPSHNLATLVRTKQVSPDEVGRIIGRAADGLAAAHSAGIVHRDVKPSNILVTDEGQVKLTDFGIARASQDATLTQTGMVTGSPAYMAPEVASGASASPASDVWSLGATLYHALAGKPPYDVKDNMVAALYRIVHEEPPRLPDAGWLAPVLEGTMTTRPEDRWSMAQVRDYLMAGPEAAEAGDPDPTATSVLPAAGLAGALASRLPTRGARTPDEGGDTTETPVAPPPPPPPPGPTREPSRPRRRRTAAWLLGAAALVLTAVVVTVGLTGDQDPGGEAPGAAGTTPAEPSTQPEATPEDDSPSEEEMIAFGEEYVPTAISDRDASWQMLSTKFQNETGRESYDGFWSTIADAEVYDVTADPDAMTISYTVEYTRQNGTEVPPEEVTLGLVERDGELLIDEEF